MKKIKIKKRSYSPRKGRTLTFQPAADIKDQIMAELERPGVKAGPLINDVLRLGFRLLQEADKKKPLESLLNEKLLQLTSAYGKSESRILEEASGKIESVKRLLAALPPTDAVPKKAPPLH